jgi:putative flavoprotein involved in K+ transport
MEPLGSTLSWTLNCMGSRGMREHHDTVVIGGGQAGLAMSAVLQQHGREQVVLDRLQIGERWRTERWESLRFQFPNWSLELPGYAYSGEDPDGFAHWREILRVIEDYAASTSAPVREHTEVSELRANDRGFALSVSDATIHARRVVIATGPFQRPRIPQLAEVGPSVLQIDPTRYRHPGDLPDGAVLVVGSGASGCQIGDELLRAGRTVFLSVSRHRRVPRRFRGKDVYWWLDRMGRFAQTIDSFPGRQWPPSTVVTGVSGGYDLNVRQMAADGVRVLGRVIGVSDGTLTVARNANQVLDEADAAFAGFPPPPATTRPQIRTWISPRRSPPGQRPCRPRSPRSSPSTSGARRSRRSSGEPATTTTTTTTTTGCGSRCWIPGASRSSSAGSPRCRDSTSWACTGCTRSSPACSPAWAATRSTSPNTWIS